MTAQPRCSRRRALAAALVLLASALLCGCNSNDTPAPATPLSSAPAAPQPPDQTLAGWAFPLDSWRPPLDHLDAINRASATLEVACLAHFEINTSELPAPSGATPQYPPNTRRYGVQIESEARTYGYHAPSQSGTSQPSLAVAFASRNASERQVLEGGGPPTYNGTPVPQGGCAAEATATISRTAEQGPIDVGLHDSLQDIASAAASTDTRVVEVKRHWAECMSAVGINFSDPLTAPGNQVFMTATPSAYEIKAAVADVLCKQKVKLVSTWAAVEAGYQNELINSYRPSLEKVRANFDAEYKVAQSILGR